MSERPSTLPVMLEEAATTGGAAGKLGDERRWALRRASVLAGKIISDKLQGQVGCVVRDLSATGALIELRPSKDCAISSPAGLPDTFALILVRDNSEVSCKLAWRRDKTVGVRFMGAFRMLPQRPKQPVKLQSKPVKRR
ncbi:MAG: hypothetical protein HOP09_01035 [Hyphomicrobium sp.]|nr:hypothetical protein [Hyphomicrobium sp.]